MRKMKKTRFVNDVKEVPQGARVCLYGAGQGGAVLLRLLQETRKDVEVSCFVDDLKEGQRSGLRIVDLEHLERAGGQEGLVLVTSAYWRGMERRLRKAGIDDYMVVNPSVYFAFQVFSEEEERACRPAVEKTRNLLRGKQDRELYGRIVKSRSSRPEETGALDDYFGSGRVGQGRMYTEFTDWGSISTVIEGGVGDAGDTVGFLERMQEGGRIYGFEPFYSVYEKCVNRAAIEKAGNVKILPLGLWKCSGSLSFFENEDNRDGSRIICGNDRINGSRAAGRQRDTEAVGRGRVTRIDTISIDGFVRENRIGKVDYIKLDVEGSEPEVLEGARETLVHHRPQLAVCIYHRKEHVFEIPLFLDGMLESYTYRIGQYSPTFWDTVWYCIPEEVSGATRPGG